MDNELRREIIMDNYMYPYNKEVPNDKETFIRKFTPRENFRLQGFDDKFIDNILKTVSMTQQYKQAGNAVSPPVITGIINHFIKFMEKDSS